MKVLEYQVHSLVFATYVSLAHISKLRALLVGHEMSNKDVPHFAATSNTQQTRTTAVKSRRTTRYC